jgi:PST family polysaccharide transporter
MTRDPRDRLFDTQEMKAGLGRRAGNASVLVLAIAALKMLQQIASVAIIARLVPPAEYGIFAMALPAVMVAVALSNFGLPQAIMQQEKMTHAHASVLFWLNLGFALVVTGLMMALSGPAAAYYDEPKVEPVFMVVSLSLVFSAASSQYVAILRRTLQVQASELLTLAAEIVGLIVAIVAAFLGASYWSLVLQQLVTPFLKTLTMAARTRWLPSSPRHLKFSDAAGSISFGGFVAGFSILTRLTDYVGTVIVGALFNAAETGLFSRARNLSSIPAQRVMTPLSTVFVPTMSRLQDEPEALEAMFTRLISRSNLILLPVAVIMAAGAAPLVTLMMGQNWTSAAPLMLWMSIFIFREAGSSGLQFVMIACGRSRPLFFYALFRLGLVAAAMYAAAGGGVTAMTQVYVLVEIFVTLPLMVLVTHRTTPIRAGVFMRACVPDMVFAAGVTLVLILFVNPAVAGMAPVLQLAALAAAMVPVYGLRIGVSPALRRDVLQVFLSVSGRLRGRGGRR